MMIHDEPAPPAVVRLLTLSARLQAGWTNLSTSERERLASDMSLEVTALRDELGSASNANGPGAEDVHAALRTTGSVELQPIVSLSTREVVGYEALARFPRWTPDRWFEKAWQIGVGIAFELCAVETALASQRTLAESQFLSINVSPRTLVDPELARVLGAARQDRLVLELTEHEPISDYAPYRDAIGRLRDRGVRIAIDDVGAGYSSLRHVIQLTPDVIKIDRQIIAGCDHDPVRKVLFGCVALFAQQTGVCLVAEGVETAAEADALIASGVALGQGYLFGRPSPQPSHAAACMGSVEAASRSHRAMAGGASL